MRHLSFNYPFKILCNTVQQSRYFEAGSNRWNCTKDFGTCHQSPLRENSPATERTCEEKRRGEDGVNGGDSLACKTNAACQPLKKKNRMHIKAGVCMED